MKPLYACAFALSMAACTVGSNPCDDVHDALAKCGMPVGGIDCERVDDATQADLATRLEIGGCAAIASGASGTIDPELCKLAGWPCPPPLGRAPGKKRTRYPVLFVGGIDGTPIFDWSPRILQAAAAVHGTEVHHVALSPWAPTAERSQDLAYAIENIRGGRDLRVNLVCYAVAGLDCRHLVSEHGLFDGDAASWQRARDSVASITTIATPHRGTQVADAALSVLSSGLLLDTLQGMLGIPADVALPDHSALAETLEGLTLGAAASFNAAVTDADGIFYQSWAGVSHVLGQDKEPSEDAIEEHCVDANGHFQMLRHPGTRDTMNELLWATTGFAGATLEQDGRLAFGPADGMVSVESAKWGQFRGCLPADHYDVIGEIGHSAPDPMTGFDAPRFFAGLVSELAEWGF